MFEFGERILPVKNAAALLSAGLVGIREASTITNWPVRPSRAARAKHEKLAGGQVEVEQKNLELDEADGDRWQPDRTHPVEKAAEPGLTSGSATRSKPRWCNPHGAGGSRGWKKVGKGETGFRAR